MEDSGGGLMMVMVMSYDHDDDDGDLCIIQTQGSIFGVTDTSKQTETSAEAADDVCPGETRSKHHEAEEGPLLNTKPPDRTWGARFRV